MRLLYACSVATMSADYASTYPNGLHPHSLRRTLVKAAMSKATTATA